MGKYLRGVFAAVIITALFAGVFEPERYYDIQLNCPSITDWDTLSPIPYNVSHAVVLSDSTAGDTSYFYILGGYANDTITGNVIRYNAGTDIYDADSIVTALPERLAGGLGFTLGDSMYYGGGYAPAWTIQTSPIADTLFDISYPTTSTGYISCRGGKILKTTNNGSLWDTISADSFRNIISLEFRSSLEGFALARSDTSVIYKTTNGGTSWLTSSFANFRLNKLDFPIMFAVWAAGNSGVVFRSANGGFSWSSAGTGSPINLNSISALDSSAVWAAGDSGRVFRTTNGGAAWIQDTITASKLNEIEFINSSTGFTGGEDGVFFKTTDGGVSWTQLSIGINSSITDIEVFSGGTLVVTGDGGFIVCSEDLGVNWKRNRGVTGADIFAVSEEEGSGFATLIGSPGLIIKSDKGSFDGRISKKLYKLDLSSPGGAWVERDSLPVPLAEIFSNCEEFNDSLAYVVGGKTDSNRTVRNVYRYNSRTNSWAPATPLPDSLSLGGLAVINDTTIVFAGGRNFSSISDSIYYGRVLISQGLPDSIIWTAGPFSYPSGGAHSMGSAGLKQVSVGLFAGGSRDLFPENPVMDSYLIRDTSVCPVPINVLRIVKPVTTSGCDGGKDVEYPGSSDRSATDTTLYYFHVFGGIEDSVYTSNNLNRRLRVWDTKVSVQNISAEIPGRYSLSQNYPNPFNPVTSIIYEIPRSESVTLKVYDLAGREMAVLVNEFQSSGTYLVKFGNVNLASGIYIYSLRAGAYRESRYMAVIK